MSSDFTLLMCAPDAFDLKYEINSWMSMENRPNVPLAAKQWKELYRIITEEVGAKVELIQQAANAPDMVFTANAGLVDKKGDRKRILLSRFAHPERQVEVAPFRAWFEERGYECAEPPQTVFYEGEGDSLWCGAKLVSGYLKRSDIASHNWLADQLGCEVLPVELVDGRWYHLDTAFFSPSSGVAAYYPGAFDTYAQDVIKSNFETIEVEEVEALRFACNSVVLGNDIVMPSGCPKIGKQLEERGFTIYTADMSEFLKAGGACKCLSLIL